MHCVGENDFGISRHSSHEGISKAYLIVPAKNILIIFYKAIIVMSSGVRRIDEYQVVTLGLIYRVLKITAEDGGDFQSLRNGLKVIVVKHDCGLSANRDIEFSAQIFTI